MEWVCRARFNSDGLDLTGDGAFTISDVQGWMKFVFFLPGDAGICLTYTTAFGRFLELSPLSLFGWGSGIFSGLAWFLLLLCAAAGSEYERRSKWERMNRRMDKQISKRPK